MACRAEVVTLEERCENEWEMEKKWQKGQKKKRKVAEKRQKRMVLLVFVVPRGG